MLEDEPPGGEVEHAVLHEVARPVLPPGPVGGIEVEGHRVLVRGDLVFHWTLFFSLRRSDDCGLHSL